MTIAFARGGLAARLAWAGPYAPFLGFTLILCVGLSLSRAGLIAWHWARVEPLGAATSMLLQGLRSDLIIAGWAAALPLLVLPLLKPAHVARWIRWTTVWLTAWIVFVAFMELATPQFLIEYGVRPNRTFAEYLIYPKEVFAMLWAGYRPVLFGAFAILGVIGWATRRHFRSYPAEALAAAMPRRRLLKLWPLAVILVFLMIRSNFHGRPVHLGNFAFCDDATVNSLVANSSYSMLFAVYEMKHETGISEQYGEMPVAKMIAQVRADMGIPASEFLSDELPTLHRQTASVRRDKPLNLVIVLAESFGAKFFKEFGGAGVTPEMDRLAGRGVWFERLYATGTRTSRGIEAAIAGFPPTPAESVVRLSKAQKDFFTLATALRNAGYRNEFVYGGDSNFDNRRRFFLSNGFHQVIDRRDYSGPVFDGHLGVADDDMLDKAHQTITDLHAKDEPFFVLALMLTNHPPFDFPDGRIELVAPNKQSPLNTARFTDYAIGKFIAKAETSDYWKDTLILVMADHEGRQHTDTLVPVEGFHIPGLILGADTQPRRIASVASQIDIAPTLLSLMGLDAVTPFLGRDLTRTLPEYGNRTGEPRPRAMMQFNHNFGWLQDEIVTVLSPDGSDADRDGDARQFRFDPKDKSLTPLPEVDPVSYQRALANALMPAWLYDRQRYRAPAPDADASR